MPFAGLPIAPVLLEEIRARGFSEPTPVQRAVLEADTARDLVVSSQTGSGKTVAFGLAFAPALLAGERTKTPRVLVVAPTRELAQQVAQELSWLYAKTGARIGTCVGGMDPRRESRALSFGVDCVVGTPGRLRDHIERGALRLGTLSCVVLDEADEMLDMGFREELEAILDATPEGRRTLMFSATFPRAMEQLAGKYLTDPQRIRAGAATAAHEDIDVVCHLVAPREREHAVVNVLRFYDAPSALVFCATRDGVAHMHAGLSERGFHAVALSGELSQAERNRALLAVREGHARVLVATDVAARGLDLPAVALVVHADLPQDTASFQHRSGRTGRAGKKGTAVVLTPFSRRRFMERMLSDAHVQARFTALPTTKQIRSLDDQRLVHEAVSLAADGEPVDPSLAEALLAQLPPDALAAALVRTLRRDLPSPEETPETAAWKSQDRDRDRGRGFERGPRDRRSEGPRAGDGRGGPRGDVDGVWFRVNVGREQRADPKWLLPMLCRRGGITKRDLGPFEIRRRETRFSVHPDVARRFFDQASRPDAKDPNIRIATVDDAGGPDEQAPRARRRPDQARPPAVADKRPGRDGRASGKTDRRRQK